MKKLLIIVGIVIIVGVGYYAISPLFQNVVVDDALPQDIIMSEDTEETSRAVTGGIERLTPEEREDMEQQIQAANEADAEVMEDTMPESSSESIVREVMDTFGHPAEGTVRVIDTANGQIIRFEDFSTINGPQLHLYLAKDLDATEYIDLGPIRGTEGNINYTVPPGVDLNEYRFVMHWCVPFNILFNYADLGDS